MAPLWQAHWQIFKIFSWDIENVKKYAIYKEKKPSKTIKCIMICLILLIKKQDLCDTGAYLI